jgi:hypothetical protein
MASPRFTWWSVPALAVIVASPALAFDTGPHFDLTEDVLRAEGFSDNAIQTAQAANFLIDFHEFMRKDMFKKVLDPVCRAEIDPVLKIGDELQHFDDIQNTADVAKRWDAMIASTQATAADRKKESDYAFVMVALLGASLHNVQDFYAHSNWVELINKGTLVPYGTHPTWLSVDRKTREALEVYTADTPSRKHGDWNGPPPTLNKDWSGRLNHFDAYRCAWFATRQWVRLFRTFVDASTWTRMQNLPRAGTPWAFDPDKDWDAARKISFYGGHWNGNGAPTNLKNAFSDESAATSPDFLIKAVLSYLGYDIFDAINRERPCLTHNRSKLRLEMEKLLKTWGTWKSALAEDVPMPSAAPESVTFVRLQVLDIVAIDPDDGRGGGEQDWYARGRIGGQRYWTGLIDEHNNFDFKRPYYPWTMIKSLQPSNTVRSFVVRLTTGSADGAGTDGDIFLRVGNRRIEFPYAPGNNFENSATCDYSFPALAGMNLADIRGVKIEKTSGGDWQLGGVEIAVNDQVIYRRDAINVWLTDDNQVWEATDYRPGAMLQEVPLHVDLMELDAEKDDRGDINPHPKRESVYFDYRLGNGTVRGDIGSNPATTAGAHGSDKARIKIAVDQMSGSCRTAPITTAGSTRP